MANNNLKRLREEKGLSQLKLSILTEISQSDISQVENGKKYPFPNWRRKFSDALGVEENVIFPNM